MTTVINRSLDAADAATRQLTDLMEKPRLTHKEKELQAELISSINALKAGTSISEIRRWQHDRLLQAAGLPKAPEPARTALGEEVESEWRAFATGKEVRATCIPPDRELRYSGQLAGAQSNIFTQGPSGGYFVAPDMSPRLYETLKTYDQIFDPEFSNVVETKTGAVMPFPIWDDVNNEAVQISETSQSVEVTIASISSAQLSAYAFRSRVIAVSLELLEDSSSNWPIGAVLERIFAKRIARGVGRAMISGTGVASPTGLITGSLAAGAAIVIASGSSINTGGAETGATTIGSVDVGKLYAALNPAYRIGAKFYANDATIQYLAQLTDKDGRPIVHPLQNGAVPAIWGHAVASCPSFPTMGPGKNSVIFANPDYFIQRRVPSATFVRRFSEAAGLVENGLTGFEMWCRFDSNFISGDSGYVGAAILQQHS